jgi:glyoxylase-like metal-dependent hydrolase (beta-lactamase superfamily II)
MKRKIIQSEPRADLTPYPRRKPSIKRVLVVIGIVLGVIVLGLAATLFVARSGVAPVRDGQALPGGAVQIKDGFTSAFLLDAGPGIAVLIDAGQDPEAKAIKAALATRNLQPESVVAILLTHGHNDHFGGVAAFPNAEVMAMAADVALVEGREPRRSLLGPLLGARPTGVHVGHVLADGESLTLGRLQLRVFAVPGHTAGSAAFLADGVLYLGDSADSETDGTLRPAFWFVSEDTALNVASLKALAARLSPSSGEVKYLTFSHSGALEGFGPLAAFAAAH